MPVIAEAFHALLYYEQYEYQPNSHVQTQDNPYWLLCGKDALFTWLNKFPPALPIPNDCMSPEIFNNADMPTTPDMAITLDENMAKPAPNGTNNEATMADVSVAKDVNIALELNTHLVMGYNTS
ncbi:hypothetical protein ARMGADRAFT_1040593 [Armillaria gallica]|uniref:Uncharacterized protein n=1 Tax=Armillaria gallica TaxID=47427 RepID=A0A2H3CSM1_ARMGA|nr:hypothetical protein ARMGADRAFT_1040593 [Armillaria gallica]